MLKIQVFSFSLLHSNKAGKYKILILFRYLSNIRKALSTGEPNHVAYLESSRTKTYRTYVKNQKVYIHPSSALYKAEILPEYLIYHETASTTRTFMRTVSVCEGTWLPKLLSV